MDKKEEVLLMQVRLICAGTREFKNYNVLSTVLRDTCEEIEKKIKKTNPDETVEFEIVSGKAAGPDTMGETYAKNHKLALAEFPAKWAEEGKYAGFKRNKRMADYANEADKGVLVAFWDYNSRGTENMIKEARALDNIEVHIIDVSGSIDKEDKKED